MSCPVITLNDISAEKYQVLLEAAQAQGLNLVGESGSTNYQDLEFTWSYDPATLTLIIQCVDKPIFIPCSMIESRIRALIC